MRLVAFVVAAFLAWFFLGGSRYEARYALPGSPYEVVVSLSQMHPHLAEYEREIRVEGVGRAATLPLFPDTGGYALVNAYSANSGRVILRTMGNDEYLIDNQSGQVSRRRHLSECNERGPFDAAFIGAFDFDTDGQWRFIPEDERAEQLIWACDKQT